jgi:hypothetical protein
MGIFQESFTLTFFRWFLARREGEKHGGNRVLPRLPSARSHRLSLPSKRTPRHLVMQDLDVWDSLKHRELLVATRGELRAQCSFDDDRETQLSRAY